MDRNFQTRRSNETLDFRNRVVTFRFSLSTRDTVRYGHTLGTILGSSSDSGWSIGPIRDSIPLVVVFPLLLSAVPTQHPRIVANPRIDEGIRPAYILLDARVSNYGDFSTFCLLKTQKKCVSSYFFAEQHLRRPPTGTASSHRPKLREQSHLFLSTRSSHRACILHDLR